MPYRQAISGRVWHRLRSKLEHICRYIARSADSTERITPTSQNNVRYQLKTLYRNGTPHVIFEPLGLMARLAALVPTRCVNLARFHGVFALNSRLPSHVTTRPARQALRAEHTADARRAPPTRDTLSLG